MSMPIDHFIILLAGLSLHLYAWTTKGFVNDL